MAKKRGPRFTRAEEAHLRRLVRRKGSPASWIDASPLPPNLAWLATVQVTEEWRKMRAVLGRKPTRKALDEAQAVFKTLRAERARNQGRPRPEVAWRPLVRGLVARHPKASRAEIYEQAMRDRTVTRQALGLRGEPCRAEDLYDRCVNAPHLHYDDRGEIGTVSAKTVRNYAATLLRAPR